MEGRGGVLVEEAVVDWVLAVVARRSG
jgi:hypothetical protein